MINNYSIFLSTTCFTYSVFKKKIDKQVLDLIDGIEFSGGYNYIEEKKIEKYLNDFVKEKNVLIHNYFPVQKESFILNFCSFNPDIIEKSLNLTKKAVSLCAKYNVPYYSFHPGYLYDGDEQSDGHFIFNKKSLINYERAIDNFLKNFDILYKFAKDKNIKLVIENLFVRPGNFKTSINCSFDEIDSLISSLPDDAGLLIDLGHLNIVSYYLNIDRDFFLGELFSKYSDKIYEIHLSGNDGTFDQHLPFKENDWQLMAINKFIKNNKKINITLEARNLDSNMLLSNINLIKKSINSINIGEESVICS